MSNEPIINEINKIQPPDTWNEVYKRAFEMTRKIIIAHLAALEKPTDMVEDVVFPPKSSRIVTAKVVSREKGVFITDDAPYQSHYKGNREELIGVAEHYLELCKKRDDYTPAMVAPELADSILSLVGQREESIRKEGRQQVVEWVKKHIYFNVSDIGGYDIRHDELEVQLKEWEQEGKG